MQAAETRNKIGVLAMLVAVFVLGAAFLGLEIYEFAQMVHDGAGPDRSAFLSSFFALAALSPTRQRTFRRAVVVHVLLLTAAAWPLVRQGPHGSPALLGHLLLIAGVIEGAALVGWRLGTVCVCM